MAVEIFISYAHEDHELCEQLRRHLSSLERQRRVRVWTDKTIVAGAQWSDEIREALERAHLVLLLVSSDFMASDFCYTVEMGRALERHRLGKASVVPVILRSCDWRPTPLGELKALPLDGRPIRGWPDPDVALADVVKGLGPVLRKLERASDSESDDATAATKTQERGSPGEAVRGTSPADPPYKMILKALREGKVILFLGSGAALADREADWTPDDDDLPRGDELSRYLAANSGVASELSTTAGPLSWVSQCFEGVNKRPTLDDELHGIYTRAERPGRLHRLLVRFPGLVIVTLGWDRLLEAALHEAGEPYHRVLYRLGESSVRVWRWGYSTPREEAPTDVDLEVGEIPVVFQLYGVAERDETDRDRLIVTERDYAELVRYLPDALPSCFARPFKKRHHLVLGCDLDAWSERLVLDQVWQTWKRERAAWAVHRRLPPLEREHWSREHDLTIFPVPLGDFVSRLEREADVG